jgi:hypothetical protein
VGLLARHPLPAAICGAAIVAVSGFFIFARPQYRPANQGETIRIPAKHPAADAAGRAGWTWSDGVPGWEPGYKLKDFNISEMQAIEAEPAQLSAAHAGLDAEGVRVLAVLHAWPGEGPLAIFAAPRLDTTPTIACLGAMLPSGVVGVARSGGRFSALRLGACRIAWFDYTGFVGDNGCLGAVAQVEL